MNYLKAKKIADRLVELFTPSTDRIHIAGSIRRQKEQVKDIEIVCQPKKIFIPTDLFGAGNTIIDPEFSKVLEAITHTRIKGQDDGKYIQIILKKIKDTDPDIKLDLFMPDPDDYYRQYAIRTGSREYSHKVIAEAWVKKGWCGTTNAGLRHQRDCTQKSSGWYCFNEKGEKPPVWQSEEEFFDWIGVQWIEPNQRYA